MYYDTLVCISHCEVITIRFSATGFAFVIIAIYIIDFGVPFPEQATILLPF